LNCHLAIVEVYRSLQIISICIVNTSNSRNTFDNDIDENDIVMSVAQYDNLVDSIKRGQTEIHPLSDTTTCTTRICFFFQLKLTKNEL
jgi:hypothetical protein